MRHTLKVGFVTECVFKVSQSELLRTAYAVVHVQVVVLPLCFVHAAVARLVLAGTACAGVHVEVARLHMLTASAAWDA